MASSSAFDSVDTFDEAVSNCYDKFDAMSLLAVYALWYQDKVATTLPVAKNICLLNIAIAIVRISHTHGGDHGGEEGFRTRIRLGKLFFADMKEFSLQHRRAMKNPFGHVFIPSIREK